MTSDHSQTLLAQFQTNLNKQPKLSRQMVLDTFQQTVDAYFQTLAPAAAPVAESGAAKGGKGKTKAKKEAVVVAPKEPKVAAVANSQWPKILNSKEFGLTKFFSTEFSEMKTQNTALNYFTAVKTLRDQHEGGPRWAEYLAWVRTNNPNAPAEDPPARGKKTEAAPAGTPASQAV